MTVDTSSYYGGETESTNVSSGGWGYDPKKSSVYNTSYVLLVLDIMNTSGMQPDEDIMQTESNLMNTTAEIQSDLTNIQQYLTYIENMSHSEGAWKLSDSHYISGAKGIYGPNAADGIAYNEFHENPQVGGDATQETVAPDFKNETNQFLASMQDLFVGKPCSTNSPMRASNFTKFSVNKTDCVGRSVTQTFDLSSIYSNLNSNVTTGWGLVEAYSHGEKSVFSSSDTKTASLIQQYTYYQYKLSAEKYHGFVPNEDPTKIGFSMDPTSSNFDGVGKSLFQLLNSFNKNVEVDRENEEGYPLLGSFSSQSQNFLYYIFDDPYGIGETAGGLVNIVNIYGAMAFAAFNYAWTKNPNISVAQKDGKIPQPPKPKGSDNNYKWAEDKGNPSTDDLSTWYSDAQSSSSLVSSQSNENSTDMQELSSEISQFQNIGQNIIKSNNENLMANVQNFKNG